jgi:hypothetical protein
MMEAARTSETSVDIDLTTRQYVPEDSELQDRMHLQNVLRLLCVQTGSGAHAASCSMGTGGPFPGGKARPGRDAEHSPPSSAEVENE